MPQGFIDFFCLTFFWKRMFLLLTELPALDLSHIAITIIISVFIASISRSLKFLRTNGSAATFFLACIIYGLGGWKWTTPILTFFILSSILSATGIREKKKFETLFEKTGIRDWGQVAANGGVAGIILMVQFFFPEIDCYPLYLGAVAAVTADTWGTEIGLWFNWKTISINHFTVVEPGTSGGVSVIGCLGGVIGAIVISSSSLFWTLSWRVMLNTILAGISGSVADSLFGGTIQAIYLCPVCNKTMERNMHCNTSTVLIRGFRRVNNDVVNALCALAGAITAWILTIL